MTSSSSRGLAGIVTAAAVAASRLRRMNLTPIGVPLAVPFHPSASHPAEELWPLTNDAVANLSFAYLNEPDAVLRERCATLAGMPEAIRSYTDYDWRPADVYHPFSSRR